MVTVDGTIHQSMSVSFLVAYCLILTHGVTSDPDGNKAGREGVSAQPPSQQQPQQPSQQQPQHENTYCSQTTDTTNLSCDRPAKKDGGIDKDPALNSGTHAATSHENKYTSFRGHLEPFGTSGSKSPIREITGFPKKNFFLDYLLPSIPVLMKGATRVSPSFHIWANDDYLFRLASLEENRNLKLEVEKGKKENRENGGVDMTYGDFLLSYNQSDIYMVNDIHTFLEPFLMMPCPLQCPHLAPLPLNRVMWFSSGGTKSVVHTDSLENINCLYRGTKTIFMLDPTSISTGSITDDLHSSYSTLDVDRVDLNLFPTLRNASFLTGNMEAGDCLYIPYHWIHQVRSYGSNLAVNIWFDYKKTRETLRKGHCMGHDLQCDPTFTLGRVDHPRVKGLDSVDAVGVTGLRHFFEYSSIRGEACLNPDNPPLQRSQEKVDLNKFVWDVMEKGLHPFATDDETIGDEERWKDMKGFMTAMRGMDRDGDGVLTSHEFDYGIGDVWAQVMTVFERRKKKKKMTKADEQVVGVNYGNGDDSGAGYHDGGEDNDKNDDDNDDNDNNDGNDDDNDDGNDDDV